jgi:hypothetical protein
VKILDAWKKNVADGRKSVQENLAKLDVLMEDAHPDVKKQLSVKLDQARKIIETIAFDQSGGTHNTPYAMNLIQRSERSLREASNILTASALLQVPEVRSSKIQ